MKTVTLTNESRFVLTLNLPPHQVPEMASRQVVGVRDHNPTTGERSLQAKRLKVGGAIILMPKGMKGDTAAELPMSVLKSLSVQKAIVTGKCSSKVFTDEETAKLKVAAEKAAEAAAKAAAEHAENLKTKMATRRAQKLGTIGPIPAPAKPVAVSKTTPKSSGKE